VLSDFERRSLREMERRLAAEDPEFVQGFAFPRPRQPAVRRRRPRFSVILAELVAALTIMDPQPLTDAQIAALAAVPAPRRRTR
jgi:hypothetical protein